MKAIKISSKVRAGFGIRFFSESRIFIPGIRDFLPTGYPDKKPPLIKDSQSIVLESMIIPTITFYNEKKQYIGYMIQKFFQISIKN